jgi:hypothetical protein
MFVLSKNACKLFLAPRAKYMECKTPDFPKLDLKLSSSGAYKYFLSDKLYVVVFPESTPGANDGFLLYAFFKRDFSNFSGVKATGVVCEDKLRQALLNVRFDCGEQFFKMMCAILHVDPDTDENLNIMADVFNADEPKDAKTAPNSIKGFNKCKWDDNSLFAMIAARMYMNRDPVYRNRNLEIARIAKENGVRVENVFMMEATEITPAVKGVPATETTPEIKAKREYPADSRWGSAVGVKRLSEYIAEHGKSEALLRYLVDPIGCSKLDDCISIDGVRLGQNCLGVAMMFAFKETVGENYEYLGEDMDAFLVRCEGNGNFDYLKVSKDFDFAEFADSAEPEAKRSRTGSNESIDLTCAEVLGRCESDAEDGEVVAFTRTASCRTGSA